MNRTSKEQAVTTSNNAIVGAFNPADKSLTTSSFVTAKVGHKIVAAFPNSVTETYSYYDETTLLYVLTVVYTDSTKATLSSVERTA